MKPAIEIKNLSKKYRRGSAAPYLTLRDSLANLIRRPQANLRQDEFWALKDINLEIKPGEVVGIIGRNGAGKSTLLKILSRITHPTDGEISISGKVGSLLEIGTGFHPELSGRENIYLNGAVLGMSRRDIDNQFSAIVNFADIKDFLDTPVKHYSSGMYTRLAFAVAAHLNSEILLIDEVLAVGDIEFQKKCFDKMHNLSHKDYRTVILVSHNISAIRNLCDRVILLDKGKLITFGETEKVIAKYLKMTSHKSKNVINTSQREGTGELRFINYKLSNLVDGRIKKGDTMQFTFEITNTTNSIVNCRPALSIRTAEDIPLISCDAIITGKLVSIPSKQNTMLTCTIKDPHLNPGKYLVNIALFKGDQSLDWLKSAFEFEVLPHLYRDQIIDVPFPIYQDFEWKAYP